MDRGMTSSEMSRGWKIRLRGGGAFELAVMVGTRQVRKRARRMRDKGDWKREGRVRGDILVKCSPKMEYRRGKVVQEDRTEGMRVCNPDYNRIPNPTQPDSNLARYVECSARSVQSDPISPRSISRSVEEQRNPKNRRAAWYVRPSPAPLFTALSRDRLPLVTRLDVYSLLSTGKI